MEPQEILMLQQAMGMPPQGLQEMPVDPEMEAARAAEEEEAQRLREMDIQQKWLSRIEYEQAAHDDYRVRARQIDRIYRNDIGSDEALYVPLFWSVVNVEIAGVYSAQPVPDVRPANESSTEIFSAVATVLERGCRSVVDDRLFDMNMGRAVEDFLAPGLGIIRAKLDSDIGVEQNPETGAEETIIGGQRIRWEYVPFDAYGWEPCNHVENCNWIYFRHAMTPADIKRRFKRDVNAASTDDGAKDSEWKKKTRDIYEIWDKDNKKVVFLAEGEDVPLEIADDPFGLLDFFPCVTMWCNLKSKELIPVSDYEFIEPYDLEINRLQERRMAILDQIRASGAYDKGFPELQNMFELDDAQYVPMDNMSSRFNAMGGPENAIYHLPLEEKVATLYQLTEQIKFVKSQVDEVMGISDIIRGVTKASESASAQEIKGRWVGVRLSKKREKIQYAVREMMRITTQIMTSAVTPDNLFKMTQMPITGEMQQLMQDKLLTHFSIDVETESTVAKDEAEERRAHQEMLNGVAQYAQTILPAMMNNSMPADVGSAILRSALRPYSRYDRGLDQALKTLPTTQQQLQGMGQQMGQMEQQIQGMGQELQSAMAMLNELQMKSTEATTAEKMARARKNNVDADRSQVEIMNERIEPLKTAAETGKIVAETNQLRQGRN